MTMTKEYKRELGQLRKVEKKLKRDASNLVNDCAKQFQAIHRKKMMGLRATTKEQAKLRRRILILEGRLS